MSRRSLAIVLVAILVGVAILLAVTLIAAFALLPSTQLECPERPIPSVSIPEARALVEAEAQVGEGEPQRFFAFRYTVRFCQATSAWWSSGNAPSVPGGPESGSFRLFPESLVPDSVQTYARGQPGDSVFLVILVFCFIEHPDPNIGCLEKNGWVDGEAGLIVTVE